MSISPQKTGEENLLSSNTIGMTETGDITCISRISEYSLPISIYILGTSFFPAAKFL